MFEQLLGGFVSLFAVLNPLTVLPTFVILTKSASSSSRIKTAIKSCGVSFIIILCFAFVGESILDAMNTSTDALKISGGMLLAFIAFKMIISPSESGDKKEEATKDSSKKGSDIDKIKPKKDYSIFPLAVPLIAGPGSLVVVMTQFSEAGSNLAFKGWFILCIALVIGILFVSMFFAEQIINLMGDAMIDVFQRLFGMILAAFSMQLTLDGLTQMVADRFSITSEAPISEESLVGKDKNFVAKSNSNDTAYMVIEAFGKIDPVDV
jgi:multiple antibiotic resistance protein